jgi:hypothetical protein
MPLPLLGAVSGATALGLLNLLLEGKSASDIGEVRKELKHLVGHLADRTGPQDGVSFEDTDPNAPGVQVGIDFEELQDHLETARAARGCACQGENDGCF